MECCFRKNVRIQITLVYTFCFVFIYGCQNSIDKSGISAEIKLQNIKYTLVSLNQKVAGYYAEFTIMAESDVSVDIDILVDKKTVIKIRDLFLKQGANNQLVSFVIHNPKLWWPAGMGQAFRYQVFLKVINSYKYSSENSQELMIRQIDFIAHKDSVDSKFTPYINSVPLVLKGIMLKRPNILSADSLLNYYKRKVDEVFQINGNYIVFEDTTMGQNKEIITVCDSLGILFSRLFFDKTKPIIIKYQPSSHDLITNNGKNKSANSNSYYSEIYGMQQLKEQLESARLEYYLNGVVCDFDNNIWMGNTLNVPIVNFAIKDGFGNCTVIFKEKTDSVDVFVCNDQNKGLDLIVLCKLSDFFGKDHYVKQIPVSVNANSLKKVLAIEKLGLFSKITAKESFLSVQISKPGQLIAQNVLYFEAIENLALPEPIIKTDINIGLRSFNLILKSNTLVKNVILSTKKIPSTFSENNFDLLPDKKTKITIWYTGSKEDLISDICFQSYNKAKIEFK